MTKFPAPPPPHSPSSGNSGHQPHRLGKHKPLLGIIGLVALLAFTVHACVTDQKKKEIQRAIAKMDKFETDWNSDLQIATATSRIALAGPVMKLREREEELASREVPECLSKGKTAFLAHMRASIQAFTSFMADREYTSSAHMLEAAKQIETYNKSKAQCEKLL